MSYFQGCPESQSSNDNKCKHDKYQTNTFYTTNPKKIRSTSKGEIDKSNSDEEYKLLSGLTKT